MLDGQVDYTSYTRAQLWDALRHIDRARFPENLANLERTLAALPPAVPAQPRSPAEIAAARKRLRRWASIVVAVVALLAVAALVIVQMAGKARIAKATQATYAVIAGNSVARAELGAPIVSSAFTSENDEGAKLKVKVSVKGPKASGVVTGRLRPDGADWKFGDFELMVSGKEGSVDLAVEDTN